MFYLKEQKGKWISGERISNRLSVTRSAVWKHIGKLREEGYIIESSPRKGYLFRKVSDLLLADEIRERLDTKVFGRRDIICLKETDSTNMKAKDSAAAGGAEGTVIIAEKQTKGRGRRGRDWFSYPGGGIYISIILRPEISPGDAPVITLMTAVAAAETLICQTGLKLRIKWPNDILVNEKKIAGILTEISTEMDTVDYIVVGLGLNVNIPSGAFPEDIRKRSTSILIETGERFSRIELIGAYLGWYEKYYEIFKRKDIKSIMHRWKELADIIGKRITVDASGRKIAGEVVNVGNDGVLLLKDDQEKLHRIFSGDVIL